MCDRPLALVVGAAGGIGAAVVDALAETHRLHVADLDAGRLAALGERVPDAVTHARDLADDTACTALIEDVEAAGPIDVLVLTAGLSAFGDVPTGDPARWKSVFDVNTLSVMYLVRTALRSMLPRRVGHIVVVASVSGRITYVGEPAYVASKHATVAFCDCVRQELGGTGLRLTLVEPGMVDTPMANAHPLFHEAVKTMTPLTPADVASAIVFALSQPPNVNINEIVLRPVDQVL